jgi:hypothetical protein
VKVCDPADDEHGSGPSGSAMNLVGRAGAFGEAQALRIFGSNISW